MTSPNHYRALKGIIVKARAWTPTSLLRRREPTILRHRIGSPGFHRDGALLDSVADAGAIRI